MKDQDKTKKQLIEELMAIRQRVVELEAADTDRKRAEEALQYRVEIERLITTISTKFINLAADEVDSAINNALRAIGEFAGVARSYVFLLCDNGTKMDNTHEWRTEGMEPRIQKLKGVSVDDLPWALEELKRVEAIHIPCLANPPTEASIEKELWELQDIQSLIVVPMICGGSLVGFLGFDSTRGPRIWTEDIIVLLKIVGEIFANALERRRTEQALAQEQYLVNTLMNNVPDHIYFKDTDSRFIRINRALAAYFGLSDPAQAVGKTDFDFFTEEHAQQAYADEQEVMIYGQPLVGKEEKETWPEGRETWVSTTKVPLRDKEGKIIGTFGISRDITERKRVEERIRLRDRLAAVGQLAAGIAHDFNNILTSIIGFTELVHMRADVPESAKTDLKRVMEGGHRAAHLIRQILDFSRKSLIRQQPLDLAPFLKEAVRFLQRTIPESIHIVLEMGPDEYLVYADPAQMQQVLTNLAVNARDAMPEGGELRLRLYRFTLQTGDRRPFPSMEAGEWIALSISDTGVGIPPEVLPHVYEPFFTTKGVGEGTGLGLSQVYGIVKQHEGFIDVESQVGKGSTFIIYLSPLAVQEEAPGEEALEETPRGQGETILVVEDEPQVLGVCKAMLEHLGYGVLTALTGSQALDLYERRGEEIALVLADMVMPQTGGVELFQALRVRDPDVRVVVMTGYPLGIEGQKLAAQGIMAWVQKPLDLVQLAQVMRWTLLRGGEGGGGDKETRRRGYGGRCSESDTDSKGI